MSSKSTSMGIIDALLWRPVHQVLGWVMIASVVMFERKAFCVHIIGVTFLLLVVLHKINLCYGRLANPFLMYEQVVVAGGIAHTFVPIVGMFFPIAMYVHVSICFTVHILHLLQCYQVFNDIKMNDTQYIIILWLVNIFEFVGNFAYCFPQVISGQMFTMILVSIELSAMLISSLKLKSRSVHPAPSTGSSHASNKLGESTSNKSSEASSRGPDDGEFTEVGSLEIFAELITSRLFIMLLAQAIVMCVLSIIAVDFAIFITGLAILMFLVVVKFRRHCVVLACPVLLSLTAATMGGSAVLAWLYVTNILTPLVGAAIIIGLSLLPLFIIGETIRKSQGNSNPFHLGITTMLLFLATCVFEIVGHHRRDHVKISQVLMCATISGIMLLCLSNVAKVSRSRDASHEKGGHSQKSSEGYSHQPAAPPSHATAVEQHVITASATAMTASASAAQHHGTHAHGVASIKSSKKDDLNLEEFDEHV